MRRNCLHYTRTHPSRKAALAARARPASRRLFGGHRAGVELCSFRLSDSRRRILRVDLIDLPTASFIPTLDNLESATTCNRASSAGSAAIAALKLALILSRDWPAMVECTRLCSWAWAPQNEGRPPSKPQLQADP